MIRKATPKDVKVLLVLWNELMQFHRIRGSSMLDLVDDAERKWKLWVLKGIKSSNRLVLVAKEDDEIVGYSLSAIKNNVKVFKLKRLGHIFDLYVKEKYRGKGIGEQLVKETLAWFKKKKMTYASIGVHAINPEAHGLYKKWGFRDMHIEMRKKL